VEANLDHERQQAHALLDMLPADFQDIVDYIRRDNLSAAHWPDHLRTPAQTGNLPLPPLPLIAVYRVREHVGVVEIVNLIHGA
jgi:hypothetical protein